MTHYIIDLETTGINSDGLILEVGAIAIDQSTQQFLGEFTEIVHWDKEELDAKFEPQALTMHTSSGLYNKVLQSVNNLSSIDSALKEFIQTHSKAGKKNLIVNNNVHFDREWIKKHMPETESTLHYRMIDVSSLNELFKITVPKIAFDIQKDKKYEHSALSDCYDTLKEFKTYIKLVDIIAPIAQRIAEELNQLKAITTKYTNMIDYGEFPKSLTDQEKMRKQSGGHNSTPPYKPLAKTPRNFGDLLPIPPYYLDPTRVLKGRSFSELIIDDFTPPSSKREYPSNNNSSDEGASGNPMDPTTWKK